MTIPLNSAHARDVAHYLHPYTDLSAHEKEGPVIITRGEGIMSSQFDGYEPWFGYIPKRTNGAIISDRAGDTVPYALFSIQERGALFVREGVQVYEGMIIGEHAHPSDLNVNACREPPVRSGRGRTFHAHRSPTSRRRDRSRGRSTAPRCASTRADARRNPAEGSCSGSSCRRPE